MFSVVLSSPELGVTRYKSSALHNIITFVVTSNITRYMPL